MPELSGKKSYVREKHDKEDEFQRAIERVGLTETKTRENSSGTPLLPATNQIQKQDPTLLVTDSWRLANQCMVVTEISMPPSQESSSDSVFTDPEELAGATNGAKEEAASTSLALVLKSHEVEPSSMSPLFGERNSRIFSYW